MPGRTGTIDRYKIEWTTSVTGANDAPEATTEVRADGDITRVADYAIPVAGCKSIAITGDTSPTDNTATDLDINVIASVDGGTTFDDGVNHIYTSKNFGDAEQGTFLATPGPTHIKLRVDENGAGNAEPIAYVTITWET
jgi:hypothetical protein